jgi:glycyl-radical enzyme activating protein
MNDGMIFNIQRFSVNDGPGVRTTVFFKGCPLRCLWCHNPESYTVTPEIMYHEALCVGCGRCVPVCPEHCHTVTNMLHGFRREACTSCGACVHVCGGALTLAGERTSVNQVLARVERDEPFYRKTGGGVTLSGGEPLFQPDFLLELLKALKARRLHTCLETCGYSPFTLLESAAEFVDLFLYDYKETDDDLHRNYTGVSNRKIISNLLQLDALGYETILRCPIIPGYNNREDHFAGIATLANRLKNVCEINVMPYHPLGESKRKQLEMSTPLANVPFPDKEEYDGWVNAIQLLTDCPVKKG